MVPGFEYDIFVSYAHINNKILNVEAKGWVDFFHEHLEHYLAEKSGRYGKVTIWRDKKLDGTQLFDDVISQKIRSSALFVALASRAYYESDYCRSELADFFDTAEDNPELLKVENRYRIVHVLLQKIPREAWLPQFGRTSAFSFHDADRDAEAWAGYPIKHNSQAFEKEIKRLVDAIYDTLEAFQKTGGRAPKRLEYAVEEVVESTTVVDETHVGEFELYFADVSETLQKLRRRVVDRIKEGDKQVKVSSFLPPPYAPREHDDKVLERLKSARLSVHLLNEYPGKSMEGLEGEVALTYPQKQAELARDHALSQLVWVPTALDLEQIEDEYANYKNLLKDLDRLAAEEKRRGSTDAAQTTHDFMCGAPDDLAEHILQKIDSLKRHAETPRPDVDGILVDTHNKDTRYATQIGGFLSKSGMRVHLVPHSGDGEDAKMLYEETLKQVRSVLIVFGVVAESWAVGRFWAAMKAIINEECFIDNIFIFLAPPVKSVSADVFLRRKPVKPPTFIDHMDSDMLAPDKLRLLL